MRELGPITVLASTDEAHLFMREQWGKEDFRVKMSRAPGVLASQMRINKGSTII